MTVIFENVVLSFPRIVEPEVNKSFPGSPAKYSANIILPKDFPKMADFMAEVNKLAAEKWKEHAAVILQMAMGNKKLRCFGPGEEVINTKTFAIYKGYEGNLYLSCASDRDHPPVVVKRDANGLAQPTHDMERQEAAKRFYGGCIVNVAVSPWLQDNAGGRAIRCNLHAIEFVRDGEPLGDGASAGADIASMFAGVAAPAPAAATGATPGAMAFPGMPSFLS
jgi:hypothetical protein